MSALEHLSDAEKAALDTEVYASLARIMTGAPAPEGSVTITAEDPEDFRRQWADLFDRPGNGEDAGAADHPAATGPGADPSAPPGRR
ncbi:hypothetical protein J0910_30875 [Nocardiopsis sp. CNT-189]|uniref:hypothetical protein n=1 Tax=Nocardiopsis oceanisediminis TaxID=2816862 RepID=UPI003B38CC3D